MSVRLKRSEKSAFRPISSSFPLQIGKEDQASSVDQISTALTKVDIKEQDATSESPRLKKVRQSTFQSYVRRLTVDLVDTYKHCNPDFGYTRKSNPKRVLTHPNEPKGNHGYDNENSDYILFVNSIIVGSKDQKYRVLDVLGQGTFGQVVKCLSLTTGKIVALKVIKNKPAYFNQGLLEVQVLEMLRKYAHGLDKRGEIPPGSEGPHGSWTDYIVRMDSYFVYRKHLCLSFELLDINLYELLKQNRYRGLSTNLVRLFVKQILRGLIMLKRMRIVHCDLKPENILLVSLESPQIKLIDFGSACFEHQTVYTYVQSRFYRSPEVLLGCGYTMAIDMWSLGCIAAELFLGLPLFPGNNAFNQLSRIISMLGMPPAHMLWNGKNTRQFFNVKRGRNTPTVTLKSDQQYARENRIQLKPNKKYFNYDRLDQLIRKYPIKSTMSPAQSAKEMTTRASFHHFLTGLLQLDPQKRWTPEQALLHPFMTGKPLTSNWNPQQAVADANKARSLSNPTTSTTASSFARARVGTAPTLNPTPNATRASSTENESAVSSTPPSSSKKEALQKEKKHASTDSTPKTHSPAQSSSPPRVSALTAALRGKSTPTTTTLNPVAAHHQAVAMPEKSQPSSVKRNVQSSQGPPKSVGAATATTPHHAPGQGFSNLSSASKESGTQVKNSSLGSLPL